MSELIDPAYLSDLERYKQLNRILKGNSKASNSAWFTHPSALNLQLHLLTRSTGTYELYIFHRPSNTWTALGSYPVASLSSSAKLEALIAEIRKTKDYKGHRALGVMIHVDSALATTEIPLDDGLPEDISALRDSLVRDPVNTLQDESLAASEFAWRAIPYFNANVAPYATAMVMPQTAENIALNFQDIAEKKDYPMPTAVLSAPFTLLQGLPHLGEFELGIVQALLIPYDAFTVLAIIDPEGDFRLVRALQGRLNPNLINQSIRTSMISLEFESFDLCCIFRFFVRIA